MPWGEMVQGPPPEVAGLYRQMEQLQEDRDSMAERVAVLEHQLGTMSDLRLYWERIATERGNRIVRAAQALEGS